MLSLSSYIPNNLNGSLLESYKSRCILLILKRKLAIITLAAYLFATTAYPLIFKYFMDLSDEQLVERVDNKYYLDEDLIEL